MAPRTSTVLQVRWALRAALRLAAIGLIVYAMYRGYDGVRSYLIQGATDAWGRVTARSPWHFLHDSIRLALAAGLLLAVDFWLLRWLVPAGRWQCPRCGYDLESVNQPKCPECGQRLSGEVVRSPGAEDAA